MDAVLQRMLAVEEQAETLVREAERTAQGILARARKEAAELEIELQRNSVAETERLARARLALAEDVRGKTLARVEERLAALERQLRQRTEGAVCLAAERLAYPASAPPLSPDPPRRQTGDGEVQA